jgi:transcriptional regulator with XRE-family HTH domain
LRGYQRARHFARSLGIEENRYTRYERAEVEPSLTLIHVMCQKLNVTPNELLGFADVGAKAGVSAGFGDVPEAEQASGSGTGDVSKTGRVRSLAWQLATEAALIRSEARVGAKPASDPLAVMRDTGRIYSRLEDDPFGTIAEMVNDPVLRDARSDRKTRLAELVQAYADGVSEHASGP